MKKLMVLLGIIMLVSFSNGQKIINTYTIGNIPKIERFEKLTEVEEAKEKELDYQRKNGFKYLDSFRNEIIPDSLDSFEKTLQEIKNWPSIPENRSRYFLTTYKNNLPIENLYYPRTIDLTTDCNCYVTNDTLNIKMGLNLMGFKFTLKIFDERFTIHYRENFYFGKKAYKRHLSDTISTEEFNPDFKTAQLIFSKQPSYKIGEQLTGYLKLKTQDYYVQKENLSDSEKAYLKGEIYFTCKIREKDSMDE